MEMSPWTNSENKSSINLIMFKSTLLFIIIYCFNNCIFLYHQLIKNTIKKYNIITTISIKRRNFKLDFKYDTLTEQLHMFILYITARYIIKMANSLGFKSIITSKNKLMFTEEIRE